MSEAARPAAWTWDQYLDWESRQPIRHELIDGQVYAMTGGTAAHDTIGNNLRFLLRTHLHGNPCRPQGPDFKIKAGPNGRYPDAFIDCGPFDPNALVAAEPVAVFEVLSKTTEWFDLALKLRDYDAVPSIRFYAVISQDKPRIIVYTRDENHRLGPQTIHLTEGLDAAIELPDFNITLPVSALYEGLAFARDAGAPRPPSASSEPPRPLC
ncbi:MAG TPA: Uma2 family endonuclease [Rhodopila sp.]|nr:Uma2 family endonuclease [Rhodopila sp.]